MALGSNLDASTCPDPEPHPELYTVGTWSLSRGVKRPGCGVEHQPRSGREVKEKVELYMFTYSEPPLLVLG